ncbi:hypothetical protein EON83_04670 [bacterium]|nr:MAG: hypothetical protein EON83_04670 [bacterium]
MVLSTIWRLIAHHENREAAMRWSRQNHRIALGWDKVGDIKAQGYNSEKDLENAMRRFHPQNRNFKSGGYSLWNFYQEMKEGDLVIVKGIKDIWVAEVESDYFYDPKNYSTNGDYFHQRKIKITQLDPYKLWKASGGMFDDGGSIYRPLIRCAKTIETLNYR